MALTGETVLLAQLDEDEKYVSYIDTVESGKSIRFSAPIAARRGLFCSAPGHVFLAHMGDRQREAYYRDIRLEKMTAATPTDRIELERIVNDTRNRGYRLRWECIQKTPPVLLHLFITQTAIWWPQSRSECPWHARRVSRKNTPRPPERLAKIFPRFLVTVKDDQAGNARQRRLCLSSAPPSTSVLLT